ncbi:MAG: hypothetical protein V1934_06675 [Methanobacteriota archaeon]
MLRIVTAEGSVAFGGFGNQVMFRFFSNSVCAHPPGLSCPATVYV